MAKKTVNRCRPTDIATNTWCAKDLFTPGEGRELIFMPVDEWGTLKTRLLRTPVSQEPNAPMMLTKKEGSPLEEYVYNAPTGADPISVIFPDAATSTKKGLYFNGNNLIFNPTVGNGVQADGVTYQTSTFTLPIGSSMEYDELAQYLNSGAWIGIKLKSDASVMHVYGGPRGYVPTADEVSEMMFSGNNDTKGQTQISFSVEKASYAIEYITIGSQTANENALRELVTMMQAGACKPNEEVEPAITVSPTSLTFEAAGGTQEVTIVATTGYEATSKPDWITVTGTQITTAAYTDTTEDRTGTVTFALLGVLPEVTATVTVTQTKASA